MLVYDTIRSCGCYHLFFPSARVETLPASDGAGEWAFAPATLPVHGKNTRLVVRVATRSLYGPDALVAGSERAERWLFWAMGIPSAGAMRQ